MTTREQKARIWRRRLREAVRAREQANRLYARAKRGVRRYRKQSGAEAAVRWALKQVGTKEQPPNSNRGPKIDDWQERAAGYKGYPWCGAFVHEALLKGGVDLPPGVVYTPTILAWARNRQQGLREVESPRRGDLVLYDWSPGGDPVQHVGLMVNSRESVEGNTSSGNSGSQDNGGGVWLRNRGRANVVAFVRPSYPR